MWGVYGPWGLIFSLNLNFVLKEETEITYSPNKQVENLIISHNFKHTARAWGWEKWAKKRRTWFQRAITLILLKCNMHSALNFIATKFPHQCAKSFAAVTPRYRLLPPEWRPRTRLRLKVKPEGSHWGKSTATESARFSCLTAKEYLCVCSSVCVCVSVYLCVCTTRC